MSWNYRVTKRVTPLSEIPEKFREHHREEDTRTEFAIREVYYVDGIPKKWSVDPVFPSSNYRDEFQKDFELYAAALSLPVLNLNKLEEAIGNQEQSAR